MMDFLMILGGLTLLFFGGESLVRGSVAISERLQISKILIGVVVVGFGTSAPELLVSIQALLVNQPDIAVGNVVGSNIANILLILGITAMIMPVICEDKAILRDSIAVFISSVILLVLSYINVISGIAGFFMLATLILYLAYSYKIETQNKTGKIHEHEAERFIGKSSLVLSIPISIAGIFLLVIGADFLVEGASNIARKLGISEAIIGLSLVALGTSLPELATAISAAINKQTDVIIGNVLGSNLFNILSILGITAMVKPVPIAGQLANFDIPLTLGISILFLGIILRFKKVSRKMGATFLASYVAYIGYLYMLVV